VNLTEQSSQRLLELHAEIVDVLRERNILRSSNNPTGDLAEHLFCNAFPSWKQERNSNTGFDAIDTQTGKSYQIKGRRCSEKDKSRQLGAIRNLDRDIPTFDFLAAIIFSENYQVQLAVLIPYPVVKLLSTRQKHTNSHRFLLRDEVCGKAGVVNVTEKLRIVKMRDTGKQNAFSGIRNSGRPDLSSPRKRSRYILPPPLFQLAHPPFRAIHTPPQPID
jgi:hypothetical protein